jgi:hypothetical protein
MLSNFAPIALPNAVAPPEHSIGPVPKLMEASGKEPERLAALRAEFEALRRPTTLATRSAKITC